MKIAENSAACTGCMSCLNSCPSGAIAVQKDCEGFLRPVVDEGKCVSCGKCVRICPANRSAVAEDAGFERKVLALQVKDRRILNESSSGGFFSIAASRVLSCNGAVYGAAFDDDLNLRHVRIDREEELACLRGSKYVQSDVGLIYRDVEKDLKGNLVVLFVGTSCQVAGLKSFLGKDYPGLVTVDLVCHGVPSPDVFRKYIGWIEDKNGGRCSNFSFRQKKWSWHNYNICADIEKENGKKGKYIRICHKDIFLQGFLKDLFLRPSCHMCRYASVEKCADITIGDFWGYRDRAALKDKDEGISLVIAQNQKGLDFISGIDRNEFVCEEVPLQEAVDGNAALVHSFPPSEARVAFWNDFKEMDFDRLIEKYCSNGKRGLRQRVSWMISCNPVLYRALRSVARRFGGAGRNGSENK